MSAVTCEWDGRRSTQPAGEIVAGPWPDDSAEDVVVIDRRDLMAQRPHKTGVVRSSGRVATVREWQDRLWDVAVLATLALMILGVVLAMGRLGRVWQGDLPDSGSGMPVDASVQTTDRVS